MLSEAASSNDEEMSARENRKILLESLEIENRRPFKRSQIPQQRAGEQQGVISYKSPARQKLAHQTKDKLAKKFYNLRFDTLFQKKNESGKIYDHSFDEEDTDSLHTSPHRNIAASALQLNIQSFPLFDTSKKPKLGKTEAPDRAYDTQQKSKVIMTGSSHSSFKSIVNRSQFNTRGSDEDGAKAAKSVSFVKLQDLLIDKHNSQSDEEIVITDQHQTDKPNQRSRVGGYSLLSESHEVLGQSHVTPFEEMNTKIVDESQQQKVEGHLTTLKSDEKSSE